MTENDDWYQASMMLAERIKELTKDLTGLKSIISEMGARVLDLEKQRAISHSNKVDDLREFLDK
jgi:hypothetical protein